MTTQREDLDVKLAEVQTKVSGLSIEQVRLNTTVTALQGQMQTGFDSIRAAISLKGEPQWTVIWTALGVGLSLCIAIGTLVYMPIKAAQDEQKAQLNSISSVVVPRAEHDRAWREQSERERENAEKIRRVWDSFLETRRKLDYLDGQLHPLK